MDLTGSEDDDEQMNRYRVEDGKLVETDTKRPDFAEMTFEQSDE